MSEEFGLRFLAARDADRHPPFSSQIARRRARDEERDATRSSAALSSSHTQQYSCPRSSMLSNTCPSFKISAVITSLIAVQEGWSIGKSGSVQYRREHTFPPSFLQKSSPPPRRAQLNRHAAHCILSVIGDRGGNEEETGAAKAAIARARALASSCANRRTAAICAAKL